MLTACGGKWAWRVVLAHLQGLLRGLSQEPRPLLKVFSSLGMGVSKVLVKRARVSSFSL